MNILDLLNKICKYIEISDCYEGSQFHEKCLLVTFYDINKDYLEFLSIPGNRIASILIIRVI